MKQMVQSPSRVLIVGVRALGRGLCVGGSMPFRWACIVDVRSGIRESI